MWSSTKIWGTAILGENLCEVEKKFLRGFLKTNMRENYKPNTMA